MDIKEIKQKMLEYNDFFGGKLSETQLIKSAKTKKELAAIIDKHEDFMDDMLSDAKSSLNRFKEKLGLTLR